MSRVRAVLLPALVQALVLLGLAAALAVTVNASHPGGLPWKAAPVPAASVPDAAVPDTVVPDAAVPDAEAPDSPAADAAPDPASEEAASAPSPSPAAPEVDLDQALALHAAGVLFMDARFAADYADGHIPGALSAPPDLFSDQLEALLRDGPKDRPLVAYCQDPGCPLGQELAENLRLLGYTGVRVFAGGMAEWIGAGHPMTEGEKP